MLIDWIPGLAKIDPASTQELEQYPSEFPKAICRTLPKLHSEGSRCHAMLGAGWLGRTCNTCVSLPLRVPRQSNIFAADISPGRSSPTGRQHLRLCKTIGSMHWRVTGHCYCSWLMSASPARYRSSTPPSIHRSTQLRCRRAANCVSPGYALFGACRRPWVTQNFDMGPWRDPTSSIFCSA